MGWTKGMLSWIDRSPRNGLAATALEKFGAKGCRLEEFVAEFSECHGDAGYALSVLRMMVRARVADEREGLGGERFFKLAYPKLKQTPFFMLLK